MYDVIIIGAGASGLYASNFLKGLRVLVLEKNAKTGLKILASGGGQCNVTHDGPMKAFYTKYGAHHHFVKHALNAHTNQHVMAYFERLGVPMAVREDGKVFPKSLKASDIQQALYAKALKQGVTFMCQRAVDAIIPLEDAYKVSAGEEAFVAKNIIVATGGMSYPALGTTGDGYELARSIGVEVTPLKPGLTSIKLNSTLFSELQGIVLENVGVKHASSKKPYYGRLLFTHFGLSGPVILDHSRYFGAGDKIALAFIDVKANDLEAIFLEKSQGSGDKPIAFFMNSLEIPERIRQWVLKQSDILPTKKLAEVSKKERQALVKNLTGFEVNIDAITGFHQAMVTVGGIALSDVRARTMAHVRHQRVYFTGELLDVDGDSGGYNLQWAFSSAYVAAQAILEGKGDRS